MTKLERGIDAYDPEFADVPLEQQLQDAIVVHGIPSPQSIVFDGEIHRFDTGKKGDQNGWYIAHNDGGRPAGAFGCWRRGISESWRGVTTNRWTAADDVAHAAWLAEVQAKRDADTLARQAAAAAVVNAIWDAAQPAPADHPYLVRKGIKPHGLKIGEDGRLLAPMCDVDGNLCSLQHIDEDGEKRYHKHGKAKGSFCFIGTVKADDVGNVGTIYVTEGYATGATVHEVTGRPVVVAYSANQLPAVMGSLRSLYQLRAELVIIADNDDNDVGERHAEQAIREHGGRVVVPPLLGDANDYVAAGRDLAALLRPDVDDFLVRGIDFADQPAPIAWLVKGWLQAKALMMVHGPSGQGKTFAVLQWCLSMGAGVAEWRGCRVKQGTVIYLAGEGHHGLRGRVRAWMEHQKMPATNIWISRAGCNLDEPAGMERVVRAIDSVKARPSLIVVDTLHRFLDGDENDAGDVKKMLDACGSLMEQYGCSVLLVHHTGNNAEAQHRARGSSAWRGALDIEISVTRDKDGETIKLAQMKSKDAELLPPVFGRLERVTLPGWIDEDGQPVTSAVMVAADAPQKAETESPLMKHRKTFENAWWAAQAEVVDGLPYLSRSALVHYLTTNDGMEESTAAQACKPAGGRIIGKLLEAQFIKASPNGWVVVDPTHASSLLLARSQD